MPKPKYEHAPQRASHPSKIIGIYYHPDPRTLRPKYTGGVLHLAVRIVEFDGAQRVDTGYILVAGGVAKGEDFKRWAIDLADVVSGMLDGLLGGTRKLLKNRSDVRVDRAPERVELEAAETPFETGTPVALEATAA